MEKPKLTTLFIFFVIILFTILSCKGTHQKDIKESAQKELSVIEVSIGGMTCLGCEQTIQKNVGKLDGIFSVKASFTTGNAMIEYLPGKVDSLKIRDAITASGYTVKKFRGVISEEGSK